MCFLFAFFYILFYCKSSRNVAVLHYIGAIKPSYLILPRLFTMDKGRPEYPLFTASVLATCAIRLRQTDKVGYQLNKLIYSLSIQEQERSHERIGIGSIWLTPNMEDLLAIYLQTKKETMTLENMKIQAESKTQIIDKAVV